MTQSANLIATKTKKSIYSQEKILYRNLAGASHLMTALLRPDTSATQTNLRRRSIIIITSVLASQQRVALFYSFHRLKSKSM